MRSIKIGIGAAMIGATLAFAPAAAADGNGFLADMDALGLTHEEGPAGMLQAGYMVCLMFEVPGTDGEDVARAVYRNTGPDITVADAVSIVISAVEQLCPQFDHRGEVIA